MAASATIKSCDRQEVNDIIEKQASTIEFFNKMMPSIKGKRGSPSKVINVDGLSKKLKNLVQSQFVTANSGNEDAAKMDALVANFNLSNGLPNSLSRLIKLKLIIEGEKHLTNCCESPTRKLVIKPILDTNHTAISNKIESQLINE